MYIETPFNIVGTKYNLYIHKKLNIMYVKLNDEECKEIIIKFNKGINKNKLSKEYNVAHGTITNIINRDGKKRIKPNSKYFVNENFFEKINNESRAYWLGFFYADGYIIKNEKYHKFYAGLGIKDIEHLLKFNSDIKSNYPIKNKIKGKYKNYCVNITNKKFTENLVKHGCIHQKTNNIKFPSLQKKLIKHFIRGFFDGDGSITCTENTLQLTICCAVEEFLKRIVEELSKEISFDRTLKLYKRKDGLYLFVNSSSEDIIKIHEYLYNNSHIYLDRKKETFDHIKDNLYEIKKIIWKNYYKKRKTRENNQKQNENESER